MPNNFLNSSRLRWLTLGLMLVLAILLFFANLFPQTSEGSTSRIITPTTLAQKFVHLTATAIANSKTQVAAQATTNANATATAIAKNPINLQNPPVELLLTITSATGLINGDPKAQMAISQQVQNDTMLKNQLAALVIVYIGTIKNDATQIANAQMVVTKIEGILQNMQNSAFIKKTVYESVVFVGSETDASSKILMGTTDLSQANLEIYLYT
jgi:hypothetical protein